MLAVNPQCISCVLNARGICEDTSGIVSRRYIVNRSKDFVMTTECDRFVLTFALVAGKPKVYAYDVINGRRYKAPEDNAVLFGIMPKDQWPPFALPLTQLNTETNTQRESLF